MHQGQEARARREGEDEARIGHRGEALGDPHHVADLVMDQRVHGHDMVEAAEVLALGEAAQHVGRREADGPLTEVGRYPLFRDADQGRRDVDRHDLGPASRRFDRQGPGAAAGVEDPATRQVGRQAGQQQGAHPIASGPHRGPNAADRRIRGEPLPGFGRGTVEIGLDLGAALVVGHGTHQSKPRKSKMSRSRMARPSQGSVPAHSVAASRRYSFCTASSSGE